MPLDVLGCTRVTIVDEESITQDWAAFGSSDFVAEIEIFWESCFS